MMRSGSFSFLLVCVRHTLVPTGHCSKDHDWELERSEWLTHLVQLRDILQYLEVCTQIKPYRVDHLRRGCLTRLGRIEFTRSFGQVVRQAFMSDMTIKRVGASRSNRGTER